jgi:hypothetical protein
LRLPLEFDAGPMAREVERLSAEYWVRHVVRQNYEGDWSIVPLRGPAGVLFTRGGTSTSSTRYVPDQEVRFDITPRNLNLGR